MTCRQPAHSPSGISKRYFREYTDRVRPFFVIRNILTTEGGDIMKSRGGKNPDEPANNASSNISYMALPLELDKNRYECREVNWTRFIYDKQEDIYIPEWVVTDLMSEKIKRRRHS